MTRAQINAIKAASNRVHSTLPAKHKKELREANKNYLELSNACDHKYPDGKSAIEGQHFNSICQICGWNDL